jgi:O-antigen/teichoic acid export membrane protein
MSDVQAAAGERLLLTEGSVYAVVDVCQQLVTLVTLPILFFFLSLEDFGVITGAIVASQITMLISTMGLDFALLRLFYVWPVDDRHPHATTIFCLTSTWSIALGVLVLVTVSSVESAGPHATALILGAWSGLFLGVRNVPLAIMRVKGLKGAYARAEVGAAVGRGIIQIALVVAGYGAVGYMAGYLVAPALSLLILVFTGPTWLDWKELRWNLPTEIWLYTAKVLPSLIVNRVLAVADRIILFRWTSLDGLGVYGAASRFSTSLKLLTGGFKLAIAPVLSRSNFDGSGKSEVYARLSRLLLLTMLLVGSALMLTAWFVRFTPWAMASGELQRLTAVLLASQFLGGVVLIRQLGFYYSPRPEAVSLAAAASAVALIAALIVLIPLYGAMGAAVAQVAGAAVNLGVLAGLEVRHRVHFRSWKEFVKLTALLVPSLAGMWLFDERYQVFLLLPTVGVYAAITAATLLQIWSPRPVSS